SGLPTIHSEHGFSLTRGIFAKHPDPRSPVQSVRLRFAASHHIARGSSAYFQISTMRCSPVGIRKTMLPCRATTDLACPSIFSNNVPDVSSRVVMFVGWSVFIENDKVVESNL